MEHVSAWTKTLGSYMNKVWKTFNNKLFSEVFNFFRNKPSTEAILIPASDIRPTAFTQLDLPHECFPWSFLKLSEVFVTLESFSSSFFDVMFISKTYYSMILFRYDNTRWNFSGTEILDISLLKTKE